MHSVGLLYSAQEFLSFVTRNPVIGDEFERIGRRFVLASPQDVFSVSLRCDWVQINDKGLCMITSRGNQILGLDSSELMLRHQLQDIIEVYQPTWAMKIRAGRAEVRKFMPEDIEQIFKEAGLYEVWTDEIIGWWDTLAQRVHLQKACELLRVGRLAERLSYQYEKKRTSLEPHWQSIESNYSGYDILSVIAREDHRKVRIEVKGTELSLRDAFFTVTRHEWRTASNTDLYRFHLWLVKGNKQIIDVDASDIEPHIPNDSGEGSWEHVRIPFKAFAERIVEIRDL
jgi:hypothetical protein